MLRAAPVWAPSSLAPSSAEPLGGTGRRSIDITQEEERQIIVIIARSPSCYTVVYYGSVLSGVAEFLYPRSWLSLGSHMKPL